MLKVITCADTGEHYYLGLYGERLLAWWRSGFTSSDLCFCWDLDRVGPVPLAQRLCALPNVTEARWGVLNRNAVDHALAMIGVTARAIEPIGAQECGEHNNQCCRLASAPPALAPEIGKHGNAAHVYRSASEVFDASTGWLDFQSLCSGWHLMPRDCHALRGAVLYLWDKDNKQSLQTIRTIDSRAQCVACYGPHGTSIDRNAVAAAWIQPWSRARVRAALALKGAIRSYAQAKECAECAPPPGASIYAQLASVAKHPPQQWTGSPSAPATNTAPLTNRDVGTNGPTAFPSTRAQGVRRIIEARRIERVVHFTPIANLRSIALRGLLSRDRLAKERIPAVTPDKRRLDNLTGCTCLSIGWHNAFMLYRKAGGRYPGWILLDIAPSVLEDEGVIFFPMNASSAKMGEEFRANRAAYRGEQALVSLFADEVDGRARDPHIASGMPTHPQAEVLHPHPLPWESVERIIVSCETDKKAVEGNIPPAGHVPVIVEPARFANRVDWLAWINKRIQ